MTPMQEYRKSNDTLGLISSSYVVPTDDREIVASYVAQLRVIHYSNLLVTLEDPDAQEVLAYKRVARPHHKKNKVAELVKAAIPHGVAKDVLEGWEEELSYLARLRNELEFELSTLNSAQSSDDKWYAVAMRYNVTSYRYNAIYELLRLHSIGKKPTVLLTSSL